MSLRLIAQDLYRAIKEVEKLEKELENTPYDRRQGVENRLRKARAEERMLRGMIEAKKEPPPGSARRTIR